jgi:YegS/Rv2252/BmrU family lipid kinase
VILRVLLIANPASRSGRALADAARDEFERMGVTCDLAFTDRPGHAGDLARGRDAGYDAVFALGGDGTAMEVVSALAGSGCPVGVLPGGTGNLLARAIGTPLDMRKAVRALLHGERALIDLGRIDGGGAFAIAAGVGIDAAMVSDTSSWLKRRLGVFAYVITGTRAAFRAISGKHFFTARVTVDGETVECTAAAVMIANFGALLEGRITLGENIHADDGILDVILFTPSSVPEALEVTWRLLVRDFSPGSALSYRHGKRIEVETDPVLPAQADGEMIGHTPLRLTVDPRCAEILLPDPTGG